MTEFFTIVRDAIADYLLYVFLIVSVPLWWKRLKAIAPVSVWVVGALVIIQSRIHSAQIENSLSSISASIITLAIIVIIIVANEKGKQKNALPPNSGPQP